ncbi:MAG TPA: T9SS type A sorting domain-containing protein, partial [Bacteroidota bacterium]
YMYATGTGGTPSNPPGNPIDVNGNLSLKNIMISGRDESVDSTLDYIQGQLIRIPTAGAGANIYIDSCIISTSNGNHVRTEGRAGTVRVTNSIFSDMGFLGRSNLGAGKGFDFRNVEVDTCHIENCTFVNWQDRIIRHYQATAPIKNFIFNHNTLVNGMSYFGILSLGRVDTTGTGKLQITNNLLIDAVTLGADTSYDRQAEFGDHGELDPTNGLARITWVIANKNTTANWEISNNYYGVSDSVATFYQTYPFYKNEGPALTWAINARLAALGRDTVNAFRKVRIEPVRIPKAMVDMNRWWYSSVANGGPGKSRQTTNFTKTAPGRWKYDYDRRKLEYYHDSLNVSFRASVQPTSTDGKVVGDTRWTFNGLTAVENAGSLPREFSISQNYPNPFNPATTFTYSVPIAAQVNIEVFDVLGRKVATLVNEKQVAGTYTVNFDASHLVSGVYFYRLTSPNQSFTKKMMLLK